MRLGCGYDDGVILSATTAMGIWAHRRLVRNGGLGMRRGRESFVLIAPIDARADSPHPGSRGLGTTTYRSYPLPFIYNSCNNAYMDISAREM
jgi:hypothetical protein